MSNSSIWPIDWTISGDTTQRQSWPGSDSDGGMLRVPQSSSVTEASPSDCLVLYLVYSLGESYPIAKMQSVYSTEPQPTVSQDAPWWGVLTPLQRCSQCIQQSPSRLCHRTLLGGGGGGGGVLTPLQRCSQCIQQPLPTVSQDAP